MRWAGLHPDSPVVREWGIEVKKYIGPTLANLRFVVQNRRKDGHTLVVAGAETVLIAFDHLKGNILPEDLSDVMFQTIGEGYVLAQALACHYALSSAVTESSSCTCSHGGTTTSGSESPYSR